MKERSWKRKCLRLSTHVESYLRTKEKLILIKRIVLHHVFVSHSKDGYSRKKGFTHKQINTPKYTSTQTHTRIHTNKETNTHPNKTNTHTPTPTHPHTFTQTNTPFASRVLS